MGDTGRDAEVLPSGGLDSGVAAGLWLADGGRLRLAVFADYGQRAVEPERRAAAALARRLQVPFAELALPWLSALARQAGSALVDPGRVLPQGTMAQPGDARSAAAVWVPARNVVLVAIAAAHAEALGAAVVVAGFNREEAATFADNSAGFVQAATACLGFGTRNAVRVASRRRPLDKPAIAAAGRRLGFTAADFWSCYAAGPEPCGACESCLRSRRAFA